MTHPEAAEQMLAFAERIFRRADGLDDVVPAEHRPNWEDRPSRFRLYPGMPRIPLPSPATLNRDYAAYASSAERGEPDTPSIQRLGVLLYLMAAPLRRKVDITWNTDPTSVQFTKQQYARGSASGGGLYPVQIYLAVSKGQDLGAGVYHYSPAQHALTPMRHGEWNHNIARAVSPDADTEVCPYYLILSVDFWTNCFKYHNFGYHVCSEDAGVMLSTLQLGCDAQGIKQQSYLAFDDFTANDVIGADGQSESVFAVAGLGESKKSAGTALSNSDGRQVPKAWQRSRQVNIPQQLIDAHRLTLLDADAVAEVNRVDLEEGQPAGLPSLRLEMDVRQSLPSVLLSRKSAWGSMRGGSSIKGEDLKEALRFVSQHVGKDATHLREQLPAESLRFALRVNAVRGFKRGLYNWRPEEDALTPAAGEHLNVWQTTYSMDNYNIDETGCILFVVGNLPKVIERYGARGYRILNAYAGMAAQLTYVAASALQLDCGVVLGVRAQHVKRTLKLESDENVFLAIYLSEAQKQAELFSFHLVPDVPLWKPLK